MSSPSTLPLTSFSPSSSVTTTPAVGHVSTNQMLWQSAVFFVVVLVVVAIIAGVVLLIWNDSWIALIRMKCLGPELALIHSPALALVRKMLCFFSTTLFPAFQHLRHATFASRGGAMPGSELVLPRFRAPELGERQLVAPHPAMLRDSRSFVPSNSYNVFELSRVSASWSPHGFTCSVSDSGL